MKGVFFWLTLIGLIAALCLAVSSRPTLAGSAVAFTGRFPGWKPNPKSPILITMQDTYKQMYGREPEVVAIHAGLECGTIVAKYRGMDAISIGPTLQDVHTPNERLQIASVKKLYDFLLEVLKRIG